jgi:hypothetical protein
MGVLRHATAPGDVRRGGEREHMTDHPQPASQEPRLAFLDLATFNNGNAVRGGCLLTDAQTRPLEFRVSGLVQPTALQRILYGKTLHQYICSEVLGVPLLRELESEPQILLLRDAAFFGLHGQVKAPLLWVQVSEEGEITFQTHPKVEDVLEQQLSILPEALRGRDVLEPFSRVRAALEEAHRLGLGEKE